MEGSWDEDQAHIEVNRASGLIDMNRQTEEEMKAIRDAVVTQDGLILSVLDVLRRVPRRVLMVLKVNDLTRYVYIFVTGPCWMLHEFFRSLDSALATTHSPVRGSALCAIFGCWLLFTQIRIFLITAKYCAYAIWQDERKQVIDSVRTRGLLSPNMLQNYFMAWWFVNSQRVLNCCLALSCRKYESSHVKFLLIECILDIRAFTVKVDAWFKGFRRRGLAGAHEAASGLLVT